MSKKKKNKNKAKNKKTRKMASQNHENNMSVDNELEGSSVSFLSNFLFL